MASDDEWIGREFGGCRLERLIGRGGMSRAYEARHRHLDVAVVVKLLDPKRAWANPGLVDAFLREARALGQVTHPHVVRVVSAGTDDATRAPYLVLEHLPGGSLRARLRAGDLGAGDLVRLVAEAGEGLGAAHARGVVHGDVKPENVLLDAEGRAKVIDFGLARVSGEPVAGERTSAVYGTPAYMAPERVRGAPPAPRADVYALGVMLYEVLADRWPFNAPEARLLMRKHLDEAPPLEPLRAIAGERVIRLVAACLSKSPADRPADGAAFARALREAAQADASRRGRSTRRRASWTSSSGHVALARRERRTGGSGALVALIVAAAAVIGAAALLAMT